MPKTTQGSIELKMIIVSDRMRQDFGRRTKEAPAEGRRESFNDLKKSIQEHGLIHPIVVAVDEEPGAYQLLAGGRRYEACKELGWKEIPCHIYPIETSTFEANMIELLENIDRKDMTFMEEARARVRLDKLLKEQRGELPQGVNKNRKDGTVDTRHSTKDTAKFLGIDQTVLNRDIALVQAADIFPEEIGKASTKAAALGKLQRIKSEAGLPTSSSAPTEQEDLLRVALKTKPWKKTDWRDSREKLKTWGANLVIITKPVESDELVEIVSVLGPKAWVICLGERAEAGFRDIIWTWTAGAGGEPQRLQENYRYFSYRLVGAAVINLKGHSAIFSCRKSPPNVRLADDELPIELYQELIQVFVNPSHARIFLPYAEEGNALLAAINLGAAAFGFSTDERFYESYCKKIDIFKPGQYTSFPGSLTNVKQEMEDL